MLDFLKSTFLTLQSQILLGVVVVMLFAWLAYRIRHQNELESPFLEGGLRHKVRVKVTKVIDGDTFEASVHPMAAPLRVRVLGIDTPESRRNAKAKRDAERENVRLTVQVKVGKNARERARELLSDRTVRLEAPEGDVIKKDGYGRYIAYVRLPNRRDYGRKLIREGFANDFGWKYPHPREDGYKKTEESRRAKQKRKRHRKEARAEIRKGE